MTGKTYRIGEAAAKLNLKTYVLRFWEMEFPQIAPVRTEKGQRLYTESDLAVLGRIRHLLHERGLTIEGARRLLREEAARGDFCADVPAPRADAPGGISGSASGNALGNPSEAAAGQQPGDTPLESREEVLSPHGPVQADLFSHTPRAAPDMDVPGLVAELQAVRRLLTF